MCKKSGETIDHLLIHCEVDITLWAEVFSRLELAWAMPTLEVDLLASWPNLEGTHQIVTGWKMVPICIIWCLWQSGMTELSKTISVLWRSLALFVLELYFWGL